MLEKIMESISGRSRTIADQADVIERLESQIKEANRERENADASFRKIERLAKQSGDRMRERISKLGAENKELGGNVKRLENELKRAQADADDAKQRLELADVAAAGMVSALAEKEAALTDAAKENESLRESLASAESEWKTMKSEHFDMIETLVAMEHRQAEKQVEINDLTASNESLRGELAAVSKERDVLDAMLDDAAQALQAIGESLGVQDAMLKDVDFLAARRRSPGTGVDVRERGENGE